MSVPEKISIKELQKAAKESPLRKGMIVRCKQMYGSWAGFAGLEFYVLSDKALAMWGHPMAVRHALDVDPDTYEMLTKAKDKDGKTIFYYTHLPADCVEVLEQKTWSHSDSNMFLQENAWEEAWEENIQSYVKSFETWKGLYERATDEETKQEAKRGMERSTRGMNYSWADVRAKDFKVFHPDMLEQWVPEEDK